MEETTAVTPRNQVFLTEDPKKEANGENSAHDVTSSPAVDLQNQVEDAEKSKSKRRKILIIAAVIFCIFTMVATAGIIYGVFFVGKKGSNPYSEYTSNMVLPNVTVNVSYFDHQQIDGNAVFYEDDLVPNNVVFEWKSFQNESYAFVQFVASEYQVITEQHSDLLHGFGGFEINVNNLDRPSNKTRDTVLNILIYELDSLNPIKVTLNGEDHEYMNETEQNIVENMTSGYIGEYFVELSIKLGSLVFIGANNTAVNSIHQYARFLHSFTNKIEYDNNWRWQRIDDAVHLTNTLLSTKKRYVENTKTDGFEHGTETKKEPTEKSAENEDIGDDDDPKRRRLQLSGCSATWYWIGDGYCDSSANNAACNWDNGDCCSQTCDSGVGWVDNDDNSYSGYSCGVNEYNCVPGCSVSNPSWLGDGYCDKTGGYNTAACGYDLGDCCADTCKPGAYSCGSSGYQCYDSSANYCSREKTGCDDNECLGLCGAGCDCWEWSCGDCHCHGECAEHDTYCSCSWWGYAHIDCINVFWINCDHGTVAVWPDWW